MNSIQRVQSQYRGLNPIYILRHNYIFPYFYGHQLIANTLDYTVDFKSDFLTNIYTSEYTSVQLNIFYLHVWMIKHSIEYDYNIKAQQLNILLNRLIKRDNVYIYSNDFDSQIHDELKRMKRCLFRSFDDYFYFGNTLKRDICDIIYLDVLNQNEEDADQIEKLRRYIEENVEQLKQEENIKLILKEEFKWRMNTDKQTN